MQRASIIGAREREQAALHAASVARADLVGYVRQAVTTGALTVIEVADLLGVTRGAVYKMCREA
ncbi:hypothetical protein GKE82_24185 [Conexibacter sp. W3-3-2]|uniref:hypothetical protein n=1 Tax=Conexibacter sp. W3-3-2 TaxID=2675227 RepID=UPI0012B7AD02|nr:hypothetical protein [Conexibacter sp. W3-3-2]MTD47308.1 hypothetical protein [Conexibacter sp. W3-3-2]